MIWSLILPAQLAVLITAVIMFAFFLFYLSKSQQMTKVFLAPLVNGVIAFLPVFFVTQVIVDSVRFGEFQIQRTDQIHDPLIRSFFSLRGTQILLNSRSNRQPAWYRTDEKTIRTMVDRIWKKRKTKPPASYPSVRSGWIERGRKIEETVCGPFLHRTPSLAPSISGFRPQPAKEANSDTEPDPLKDNILVLETPINSGGGPWVIYFDKKNQIAFHDHLYW